MQEKEMTCKWNVQTVNILPFIYTIYKRNKNSRPVELRPSRLDCESYAIVGIYGSQQVVAVCHGQCTIKQGQVVEQKLEVQGSPSKCEHCELFFWHVIRLQNSATKGEVCTVITASLQSDGTFWFYFTWNHNWN